MKKMLKEWKQFLKEDDDKPIVTKQDKYMGMPQSTHSPEEQAGMDWEREQAANWENWQDRFIEEALVPWIREFAPEEHPEWAREGENEGPVPPKIRQQQIETIQRALAKVLEDMEAAELHLMGTEN